MILTPTEVSANLGSPCWATDLPQRAWEVFCYVLSIFWSCRCISSNVSLGCPSWHLERLSSYISCPGGSVLDTHSHPSPAVGGLQSVELLFPIHFQTFSLLVLAEIQAVGKAICIKERGSLFKAVILIHRSKIMILLSHCFMESICLFITLAVLGT